MNLDWKRLRNPVLAYHDWCLKDACMGYRDGWFYVFTSAFFEAGGRVRSHVTGFRTRDFVTWSEPLFLWDGRDDGWIGLCSPDLQRSDDGRWILTYNAWGDLADRPNQLFYAISDDLETWDAHHPLGANVTAGIRAIDASVAREGMWWHLTWKREQRPMMARAKRIDSANWERLGEIPGPWQENAQLVKLDGRWRMIVQKRYKDGLAAIRTMQGAGDAVQDWLRWDDGAPLALPVEGFNTAQACIGPYLADWRALDGFIYCLYGGNSETESMAGRGNCRLALARSRDMANWATPSIMGAEH